MKFALKSALFATALAVASQAQATILTFDQDNANPNAVQAIDQTYGDNVAATVQGNATYDVGAEGFTPDVTVAFEGDTPTSSLTRWTTSYGDLVNILENESDGENSLSVLLSAISGKNVILYGFDLGGWPTTDYIIPGLSVLGGDIAFSQSNVFVQGAGGRSSFSFGSGITGSNLKILINLTGLGGNSDNIGIDNIRFGQTDAVASAVPEPATWAMMIVGFGLVGFAMRGSARTTRVSFV